MTGKTRPSLQPTSNDNGGIAVVVRRLEEIFAAREAANPTPPREEPPKPWWPDKPGELTAAEKDVLRWEMWEKFKPLICDPARCEHHRCRRTKRCREMDAMAPEMEASRANLAALQAKWPAPEPPAAEPAVQRGRRKKKGRTGVRP